MGVNSPDKIDIGDQVDSPAPHWPLFGKRLCWYSVWDSLKRHVKIIV